jgi:hypothetical protein
MASAAFSPSMPLFPLVKGVGTGMRRHDGRGQPTSLHQCRLVLRPRLGCFLPRGLGLMSGATPRLKIALRLVGSRGRDHVTMAVAESDHLVSLPLLVAAEPTFVTVPFCRRCRAVAINDRCVEAAVLMKPQYRTGEIASARPMPTHRRQMRLIRV